MGAAIDVVSASRFNTGAPNLLLSQEKNVSYDGYEVQLWTGSLRFDYLDNFLRLYHNLEQYLEKDEVSATNAIEETPRTVKLSDAHCMMTIAGKNKGLVTRCHSSDSGIGSADGSPPGSPLSVWRRSSLSISDESHDGQDTVSSFLTSEFPLAGKTLLLANQETEASPLAVNDPCLANTRLSTDRTMTAQPYVHRYESHVPLGLAQAYRRRAVIAWFYDKWCEVRHWGCMAGVVCASGLSKVGDAVLSGFNRLRNVAQKLWVATLEAEWERVDGIWRNDVKKYGEVPRVRNCWTRGLFWQTLRGSMSDLQDDDPEPKNARGSQTM